MLYPRKPLLHIVLLGIDYCIYTQHRLIEPLLNYFEGEGSSTNVLPDDALMHLGQHPLTSWDVRHLKNG